MCWVALERATRIATQRGLPADLFSWYSGRDRIYRQLMEPKTAMGMDMDMAALMRARPFDRAFIDDMVPHHRGATEMAKLELAKGRNPQARALAKRIIAAQEREVSQMNAWRTKWFGAPTARA